MLLCFNLLEAESSIEINVQRHRLRYKTATPRQARPRLKDPPNRVADKLAGKIRYKTATPRQARPRYKTATPRQVIV